MIRRLIQTLLLAAFMLLLWCLWLLTLTTGGLRLELNLLAHLLPGSLTIQQAEGTLLGGFTLSQAEWRYPAWGLQADIDHLTVTWHGVRSNVSGDLSLTIADIKTFSTSVGGKLQAQGKLQGSLFSPRVSGKITTPGLEVEGQSLGALSADIMVGLKPGFRLEGELHLTNRLETLPPLNNPWVKKPAGLLAIDLVLSGFADHPSLSGTAHLAQGRLDIPVTGARASAIDLVAVMDSNWQVSFHGTFKAGDGSGKLEGTVKEEQLTLHLHGDGLLIADLAHWHILVSPTLSLLITPQQVSINGSLLIPEALITTSEINGPIRLPEDIVYVENARPVPALPFLSALQVEVKLGDNIQIATANLKTKLTGALQIKQLPGGPVTASGELMIPRTGNNTFMAYGQTLTIRSGQMFFTGGVITNPGLAITAVRTIQAVNMGGGSSSFSTNTGLQSIYTGRQTITVGAHVTGSLENPTISLFSEPAMGQSDMLSYLIFGYPSSQISSQQTSVLLTALSALSPSGMPSSSDLTETLQKKLGISELSLESTQFFDPTTSSTVSTTALVVGKQIAPKLSLHYSVGLFYPISILNLRYQINKNWALQSENSTIDNGADLLFGIERD